MTVNLRTGVNQLTQAVANFHPENRPYLLLTGCLISGWAASAKIVDYISRTHPFIEQIKIPLSIASSFAVAGLSYFRPKTGVATIVILSIIAFALSRFKPIYSSEVFKKLLLEGYKFPPNVIVTGDLSLISPLITSLPEGLVVRGHLNLLGTHITSLPVGLVVHGDLNLIGGPLTSLLEWLVVRGDLPEELVVHGDLNLLTSLLEGLVVRGDHLPEEFVVHGDLNLITSLPEGLVVHGNLNLIGPLITSLPEQLVVGHDIDLSYTPLTSLPNWITTLGPRSDGGMRQINLTGTRLSEDIISRLREAPAPGIQFHFSQADAVPILTFSNLAEALTFWVNAANDPTLTKPDIFLENHNLGDVLKFLSRLTSTAEYQNLPARPLLAKRTIETFNLMAQSDIIKQRALDLIHQGLSTCDDRIISALGQIELAVLLHQIENSSHTEEALKQLGKSLLLLEIVNKKAKEFISTLSRVDEVDEVDEIEVYLAFQIGLAERLKLPIKTRNMIFRGRAQVTDAQIAAAGTKVETECTDAKLNAFLETWSPWMKHQRSLLLPAYEKLEIADRKLENDETCMFGSLLTQPVLYNNTVYEYAAFVKWYCEGGTDPTNREKIDLKKLKRIVIPLKA